MPDLTFESDHDRSVTLGGAPLKVNCGATKWSCFIILLPVALKLNQLKYQN